MNPEEYIPIKVDILLLKKYFDWQIIPKDGRPCENWTIKRKYYDQVKGLLLEYGIHSQQDIDNFCFLEMITWGQHCTAKESDMKNEDEKWRSYYSDKSKFGKFLQENNIKSIIIKGESKTTGARNPSKIDLNDFKFIEELLNELSSLIRHSKDCYKQGYGESWKRKPGAEVKPSGFHIWNTFFRLRNFLHDLPFPEVNDLTKREENIFAGKFFTIAGIIEPLPEESEDKTAYKSQKDYFYKRMLKYRPKKT